MESNENFAQYANDGEYYDDDADYYSSEYQDNQNLSNYQHEGTQVRSFGTYGDSGNTYMNQQSKFENSTLIYFS